MRRRDELLAAVHARLVRLNNDRDASSVLSEEASNEAKALLAAVSDPGADGEVLHAVGWLHWYRYLLLPDGDDQEDLAAALALLEPVYRAYPDSVPEQVRVFLASASSVSSEDDPEAAVDRAEHLLERTLSMDDPSSLDEAIDLLRKAVAASPGNDPNRFHYLSRLDGGLQRRFERTGVLADLEEAIEVSRQAVAATPPAHPDRVAVLSNLGNALGTRFERTGEMGDLDEAIDLCRRAVAATPTAHPNRASILSNLGANLLGRFQHADTSADLEEAVDVLRQAVAAMPSDYPGREGCLSNLGNALKDRFGRTAVPADLDEAVDVLRQAVAAIPIDHPRRSGCLTNLGTALKIRAEAGVLADLDEAVKVGRQAAAATTDTQPVRDIVLFNLSNASLARFERTGVPADLDEAIDLLRQAVAATSSGHRDLSARQSSLGGHLRTRFERTGVPADLDEAIDVVRQAVAGTPAGDPDLASRLSNLSGVLQIWFARTGELKGLDEAIDVGRQAVANAPLDYPERSAVLSTLSTALLARFERTGDAKDLEGAVEAGQQAVGTSRENSEDRHMHQTNLGNALRRRYERTGVLADLDKAVDCLRQAVDATGAGHPDLGVALSNLGGVLLRRFERTGALADLDEAVELGRGALVTRPTGHPDRARCLNNLGIALVTRFDRAGDLSDLDEAVDVDRQAAQATSSDHPDRARRLASLANALRTRFVHREVPTDLAEAVEAGRQAVTAAAPDHPDRIRFLSILSAILSTRSEHTGASTDLAQAIEIGEQVVAATPPDHPNRAAYLVNLSSHLRTRFEHTAAAVDMDQAIRFAQEAAAVATAPASVRVTAARLWGRVAARGGHWAKAADGYAAAVGLLARVAPRSLGRSDQEYWLSELAGLGTQAAACCLQAGQVDRAVELWEQGRGVLLGQALDTRTDLTQLVEEHPQLAAEFIRVRDELDPVEGSATTAATAPADRGSLSGGEKAAVRREVDRRRKLADEFDGVVATIRALPSFDRFLLPLPVGDLLAAADQGPIVLLNVSDIRSDAVVLTPAGVQVVPLPELTPHSVADRVEGFVTALSEVQSPVAAPDRWEQAEQHSSDALSWLWDAIAGPVLSNLGIAGPPAVDGRWQRLWWCPSGLLAFLPLHAAGHHDTRFDPVPQTVLDRVVSSYTPTVRALIHARRPRPAGGGGDSVPTTARLLVVAMPHTPDERELPGAVAEAVILRNLYPGQVKILHGDLRPEEASKLDVARTSARSARAEFDSVRAALPRFRLAHFACHASSDLANPSSSHLLLPDHRSRPLTVVDVARLSLDDAELAFLSACATARTGYGLADEAIHLAAAFQLAGYRHVIATLWPIGDRSAVEIAADVYTALVAHDASGAVGAAQALHDATRRQRGSLEARQPRVWASHIHSGA